MVTIYTGILERKRISRIIMKKINGYIKNNELPYISDYGIELFEKLEGIRTIRNKAAHGDKNVSYEDLCKVKEVLIDGRLLEYISWA